MPKLGEAMGVFVLLRQNDNSLRSVQVAYFENASPKDSYISVAPIQKYDTACGKGYWDCSENEPAILDLKTTGIYFADYAGGSKIIYWDSPRKTFESIGISD